MITKKLIAVALNMMTVAAFASKTQKSMTQSVALTTKQASFSGFGWYGDELQSSIDLQNVMTVPAEFRARYYITLENFTGLKLTNYKPQCDFDQNLNDYRHQASWIAKPLQEKLTSENPVMQITLLQGLSVNKTPIKIARIQISGLKQVIIASTKTDLMEKHESANLDCSGDFVGSIAQSEYSTSSKLFTCETSTGYGEGVQSVSYSFNFYNNTVTNNINGEISNLTQISGNYAFDDNHVGIKVIQKLIFPSLNSGGPVNGSLMVGNQILTCFSN